MDELGVRQEVAGQAMSRRLRQRRRAIPRPRRSPGPEFRR